MVLQPILEWVGGRESLDMRDEEGRVGKLLVLPGEPQLVTAIPLQGWRGRRTSSWPSWGMSAVWWGLTCFWRWCIQLNSLQCNSECMCSLLCLWEMLCIFEFFHCCVGQCLWSRAQWVQLGNFDSFYFGQKRRRSSWSDQTGRLQTLKKEQGLVAEAEKLFWAFRKRIDDAQFGASINGGKGKSITSDADEGGAMRNR